MRKVFEIQPEVIREMRDSLRVSTTILATFLGVNDSSIERWEAGSYTPGPMVTLLLRAIQKAMITSSIETVRSLVKLGAQPEAIRDLLCRAYGVPTLQPDDVRPLTIRTSVKKVGKRGQEGNK